MTEELRPEEAEKIVKTPGFNTLWLNEAIIALNETGIVKKGKVPTVAEGDLPNESLIKFFFAIENDIKKDDLKKIPEKTKIFFNMCVDALDDIITEFPETFQEDTPAKTNATNATDGGQSTPEPPPPRKKRTRKAPLNPATFEELKQNIIARKDDNKMTSLIDYLILEGMHISEIYEQILDKAAELRVRVYTQNEKDILRHCQARRNAFGWVIDVEDNGFIQLVGIEDRK